MPDICALSDLFVALAAQVICIHVVDNTPHVDDRVVSLLREMPGLNVQLMRLGKNFGIAHALNIGIEAALSMGATHVLLSDQDSLPAPEMVEGLLAALTELRRLGYNVAGVGPTYTDIYTQKKFPFKAIIPGKIFPGEISATTQRPLIDALSLITSGTLIPVVVFNVVGLMREDFFIDRVDTEWCLRARSRGYKVFGTMYATMYQRMGERSLKVWYGYWRQVNSYRPVRVYYQIRNSIYMWRLDYVPLRWKVRIAWYAMGVVYSEAIFGSQKTRALIMAWRGFFDGLKGKMGPFRGEA